MRIFLIGVALIATSALARTPQAMIADIVPLQTAYKQCLTDKTLELGKDNNESAETILRAVSAVCRPHEDALRQLYAEMPLPAGHGEKLMERDRKLGEDAGVAALLVARAQR